MYIHEREVDMTATIQKWGNSQGIRIPKSFLEELKWSDREDIIMTVEGGRIIIERAAPSKNVNIVDLFEGYTGEYKPEEFDWGDPAGGEAW